MFSHSGIKCTDGISTYKSLGEKCCQSERLQLQRNHMTVFLNNCISGGGWLVFKKALKHMAYVIITTIWALF